MEHLSAFMAPNAGKVENEKVLVSDRFKGPDGKPIEWEIRCITSAEDEKLRTSSMRRIPVPGRKGAYTSEMDANLYICKMAVACTVFPDLNDVGLQDSYHVMGGENLLKAMLTPGEYADYLGRVQEVCGYNQSFEELVDEAKN